MLNNSGYAFYFHKTLEGIANASRNAPVVKSVRLEVFGFRYLWLIVWVHWNTTPTHFLFHVWSQGAVVIQPAILIVFAFRFWLKLSFRHLRHRIGVNMKPFINASFFDSYRRSNREMTFRSVYAPSHFSPTLSPVVCLSIFAMPDMNDTGLFNDK